LIFVSVGTPERPFDRLIKAADRLAGSIDERIVAQIGHATYIPQKCEFFRFCKREEMISYIKSARLVISQAGFGIIGDSIKLKKPMILVPREIKYGEAIDKQYELAEYLAAENKSIHCVRDISQLAEHVQKLGRVQVQYNYKTTIPALINGFIAQAFLRGE